MEVCAVIFDYADVPNEVQPKADGKSEPLPLLRLLDADQRTKNWLLTESPPSWKSYAVQRDIVTLGLTLGDHDLGDDVLHSSFLHQIISDDGATSQGDDAIADGEYIVEAMADQNYNQSPLLQLLDQIKRVLNLARRQSGCGLVHD
jgi:hypothetical protein